MEGISTMGSEELEVKTRPFKCSLLLCRRLKRHVEKVTTHALQKGFKCHHINNRISVSAKDVLNFPQFSWFPCNIDLGLEIASPVELERTLGRRENKCVQQSGVPYNIIHSKVNNGPQPLGILLRHPFCKVRSNMGVGYMSKNGNWRREKKKRLEIAGKRHHHFELQVVLTIYPCAE